jgi:hypothetical protein
MTRRRSGSDTAVKLLRLHGRTARPLGLGGVRRLEVTLGRALRRNKPGPKPNGKRS